MEVQTTQEEQVAKAMFEADWPKDKWERLGPGHAADRYLRMARVAMAVLLPREEVEAAE